MRRPVALVLLLVLSCWRNTGGGAPAGASAQPQAAVTTGQQLADAVASYGRRNADTTLLLPNGTVRLANATFPLVPDNQAVGGRAWAAGILTILGVGVNSSVLDTSMRAGLVPPRVTSSGVVLLRNISLVNNCVRDVQRVVGLTRSVQNLLGAFSLTLVTRSVEFLGAAVYMRRREVLFQMYIMQLMQLQTSNAWGEVRARCQRQLDSFTNFNPVIRRSSAHMFLMASANASGWSGADVAFTSTENPDDPIIQAMRRDGTLMPLRWCANQTLAPPSVASSGYDPFWGPLFSTDTVEEGLAAVAEATGVAEQQEAIQFPVPAVLLHAPRFDLPASAALPNATATPDGSSFALAGALMLWGPFNDDPSSPMPVPVLDLGNRTAPLFNLSAAGQLFIMRLAFDGLAALPLPAAANGAAPAAASALTLAGLANLDATGSMQDPRAWRADPAVQLHNVTLTVPLPDFLALLTLATDGGGGGVLSVRPCMDEGVRQLAAQLSNAVYALALYPGTAQAQQNGTLWQGMVLAAYTGWGVNATKLMVRPATAVPAELTAACAAALAAAAPPPPGGGGGGGGGGSPSSSSSSSSTVGIIVGCTIGGVVLLALVALAAVYVVRHRHGGKALDKFDALPSTSPPPPPGTVKGYSTDGTTTASMRTARESGTTYQTANSTMMLSLLQTEERRLLARADPNTLPSGAGAPGADGVMPSVLGHAHHMLMCSLINAKQQPGQAAPGGGAAAAPAALPEVPSQGSQGAGGAAAAVAGGRVGSIRSTSSAKSGNSLGGQGNVLDPLARVKALAMNTSGLQEASKVANRVVIHSLLGRGGSGTVYVGEWRGLPVAVKTIVYEAHPSETQHMSPVLETAIAASVGHRNVVALYHFDIKRVADQTSHDDALQISNSQEMSERSESESASDSRAFKVFLIQELCQSSLKCALDNKILYDPKVPRNVNEMITYSLLLHIATGLEYLHGLNIIHGDLTPANVLLKLDDTERSGLVAKLADFGLSRHLDQLATHVSNVCGGTPFYVAPEVVVQRRTSPAADIFSFGVIMWQVLTGTPPYLTLEGGAFKMNPDFPNIPPEAHVPIPLQQLLCRCLQQDPHARPTASEVRAVLLVQLGYPAPAATLTLSRAGSASGGRPASQPSGRSGGA